MEHCLWSRKQRLGNVLKLHHLSKLKFGLESLKWKVRSGVGRKRKALHQQISTTN